MACVKEIFEMAVRDGIISRSPAAHLRRVKPPKPIRATPSFEEFKAIVESIRSQKFNGHDAQESADFVEFLGLAGLGKAEAAALRQSDIDWEREKITTFRHKTKSGFAIPIYPQLKPLLLRRRRDDAPNERVFKIDNAKKAIANACRRLNLPQYSHLSFRRMFITRAIERGVDVKVIAEWQGHKDGGKLILDTYSHVNRAHSHRMAQLMTDGLPENVSSNLCRRFVNEQENTQFFPVREPIVSYWWLRSSRCAREKVLVIPGRVSLDAHLLSQPSP